MTDTTATAADVPAKQSAILGALSSIKLMRESPVGMVGAFIVLFWTFFAITAPLTAPFLPNKSVSTKSLAGNIVRMGTPLVFQKGHKFPVTEVRSELVNDYCSRLDDNDKKSLVGDKVIKPADVEKELYHCGTAWLGTDKNHRDILSRIIWGSQRVLFYSILATVCAYVVGMIMGVAAGYLGGWVDDFLSFIANVILSFPILVLYVVIISTFGASGINIVLAVTFASGPGIMRIVRGLVLDLRNRDYVAAAETRGESSFFIMIVEILPNARGPLIVDACLRLGYTTITIGVLGFLGLGLPPPDPDWGGMIAETRQMAFVFPHMAVVPAVAISSLVLGFNLLADGLREISLRD